MALSAVYDLAIVGGGPAGATAAFAAAGRGLRVVVLERGDFPRDKVCGEFISAETLPLLRRMAPGLVSAAPVIAGAAFILPSGRRHEFRLPAPACGISRLALDAALWQAAGSRGAELRARASVTRVDPTTGGFEMSVAGGEVLAARALIVAAGRWWSLPGLAPAGDGALSPWIGVKARFRGLAPAAVVEMYVFRGGYCGLAPVENGWTNACCLIHRRQAGELAASRGFGTWIAGHSRPLAERLRGGEQATATVVTAPVGMGRRAAERQGALMAGDASGFVDPFVGDGLARALLSGLLAGEAVAGAGGYAANFDQAGRRGFRTAGALRACVGAPLWVQALALAALARPPLGPWLTALTRWRDAREKPANIRLSP